MSSLGRTVSQNGHPREFAACLHCSAGSWWGCYALSASTVQVSGCSHGHPGVPMLHSTWNFSIHGDIQKPSGHSPRQPAVGCPAWAGWLNQKTFQRSHPISTILWLCESCCIYRARRHVSSKTVQKCFTSDLSHSQSCGPHLQPPARALPDSIAICTCCRKGAGEHRVIPAGNWTMNCDKYKAWTKLCQRIVQLEKEDYLAGQASRCGPLLSEVWLLCKEELD